MVRLTRADTIWMGVSLRILSMLRLDTMPPRASLRGHSGTATLWRGAGGFGYDFLDRLTSYTGTGGPISYMYDPNVAKHPYECCYA